MPLPGINGRKEGIGFGKCGMEQGEMQLIDTVDCGCI